MNSLIENDGCQLASERRGNGPTVLWIQGVGVAGNGWRPQVDELAADFSCVTFDNRGIGRSIWHGTGLSVSQMARDALAVVSAHGGDRFHVVGHSLGGLVAQQIALLAPERILSLSLLCTFAGGRWAAPLTPRMVWLGIRSRVGTRAMRRRGFWQLIMPPGTPFDPQRAGEISELFGHDIGDQPAIENQQLGALRRCDLSAELGSLRGLPTLIVAGGHDPIAPPSAVRALGTAIPAARLIEVPDASHGLPITHAAQVNRWLREHFREAATA